MTLSFPSPEFDTAVAAVCHGCASEEQAQALNALLLGDPTALDEYILRVELHARLASDPDLFVGDSGQTLPAVGELGDDPQGSIPLHSASKGPVLRWALAVAACVAVVVAGWWGWRGTRTEERKGETSMAVAMLNLAVDAQWNSGGEPIPTGAPLNPGLLRLDSGMAQVVFYSGARVAIEGPAELEITSPTEAACRNGRLVAEVPPQARGFRIATPPMDVSVDGTVFGLHVANGSTELHVFEGGVAIQPAGGGARQSVQEGSGAVAEVGRAPRRIAASASGFAALFSLRDRSVAAETSKFEKSRQSSRRLNEDPSLLVHFDFEHAAPSDWRLRNARGTGSAVADGTIVGCQWTEGRWSGKPALEFRSVSDRVRLTVPGEFDSLTLATWVRVHGLDRQFNSLFMCDGFDAGTLHWLIREDGVLGLTVIGPNPGDYQIIASRPTLGFEQFGRWLHLAVVLDGTSRRAVHYVNGQRVSDKPLRIQPPFRIGPAELGNWNGRGFPDNDPFMIRNFSGAMDEFCLFSRALPDAEIHALYSSDPPPR